MHPFVHSVLKLRPTTLKLPLRLRYWDLSQKGPFLIGTEEPLTHAWSLKSTLHEFSPWELEHLLVLRCLDGALMDPMWNNYDKLLVKIRGSLEMLRAWALILWAPSQWAYTPESYNFEFIHPTLSLFMTSPLFSIISPLSMATSHLLKLLNPWLLLKLSIVWALDSSLSTPKYQTPKNCMIELSTQVLV